MNLLTKIKEKTKSLKSIRRRYKILIALLLLIIIIFILFSGGKGKLDTLVVARGEVVQTVSVTGITKSDMTAKLAFDRGGRISGVNFYEGDKARAGNIIVSLESADLAADLREKEAYLTAEKSKLDELLRGTREEELVISRTKVTNAEASLRQAELGLLSTIRDAYVKSDDAIRSRMDQLFLNPRANPTILFYVGNSSLRMSLESGRLEIEKILMDWNDKIVSPDPKDAVRLAEETSDFILKVISLLEKAALALNDSKPDQNVGQASLDAWKAALSTGRVNVSAARTALQSSVDTHSTAAQALELARKELNLEEAGTATEVISAQRAVVAQAEARRDSSLAILEKTRIRAPFNGLITKQDAVPGEIAIAGTPLVSMISENNLEIETSIPEIDSVRVKPEDVVNITFDALPGETFLGSLAFIDPAETLEKGVAYYKATVHFDSSDPRLKSGLTANLDIEIMKKENVLVVPKYAVKTRESVNYVTRLTNGRSEEVAIVLGVEGRGYAEVISGLNEGDVLSFNLADL